MKFSLIVLVGLLVTGSGQKDCPVDPICPACIDECSIQNRIGATAAKYEQSLKALNLACKDVEKYGAIDCNRRRADVVKCQQDLVWDDLHDKYNGYCTYVSLDNHCERWRSDNTRLENSLFEQALQDYEIYEDNNRLDFQDRLFQENKDQYKRFNCEQRRLDVHFFELQQLKQQEK